MGSCCSRCCKSTGKAGTTTTTYQDRSYFWQRSMSWGGGGGGGGGGSCLSGSGSFDFGGDWGSGGDSGGGGGGDDWDRAVVVTEAAVVVVTTEVDSFQGIFITRNLKLQRFFLRWSRDLVYKKPYQDDALCVLKYIVAMPYSSLFYLHNLFVIAAKNGFHFMFTRFPKEIFMSWIDHCCVLNDLNVLTLSFLTLLLLLV